MADQLFCTSSMPEVTDSGRASPKVSSRVRSTRPWSWLKVLFSETCSRPLTRILPSCPGRWLPMIPMVESAPVRPSVRFTRSPMRCPLWRMERYAPWCQRSWPGVTVEGMRVFSTWAEKCVCEPFRAVAAELNASRQVSPELTLKDTGVPSRRVVRPRAERSPPEVSDRAKPSALSPRTVRDCPSVVTPCCSVGMGQ